jgi:hypothetical protein
MNRVVVSLGYLGTVAHLASEGGKMYLLTSDL